MKKTVAVVGLGNMGSSLVRGLLDSDEHNDMSLRLYDVHPDRSRAFAGAEGAEIITDPAAEDLQDASVVLCVKPHDLTKLAPVLKQALGPQTLVISVLAGTPIRRIGEILDHPGPVVRAMPNIAAKVGCAATALSCNGPTGESHKELATRIFQGVGEAWWTAEENMDTVTGLSGSGPAYIYMVIEALTDGGVKMGMPRELAANLATQTVLGAATMVKETGVHPAILKDQVTTPAGTTISALVELETHGLRSMFVSAVVAATTRSKDLGRQDANPA